MSPRHFLRWLYLLALACTLAARPGWAAWPRGPFTNLPVCTASATQQAATTVSDGSGGVIVVWQDSRGSSADIYAQRITAYGTVATGWPANGLGICTIGGDQISPRVCSDGAGGAIAVWDDLRGVDNDIYAVRVTAAGTIAAGWPVNGLGVCTASSFQQGPQIVADGAGGAYVVWHDFRNLSNYDLFASRVDGSGAIMAGFAATGNALCTASGEQLLGNPQGLALYTGASVGGAFAAWADFRNGGGNIDVYYSIIYGNGTTLNATLGLPICSATSNQSAPAITEDGQGGALVAWQDDRGADTDIYGSRIDRDGFAHQFWAANGVAFVTASNVQVAPTVVADGTGGMIAAWADLRASSHNDVYAHRLTAIGGVGWPGELQLTTDLRSQYTPFAISDGAGGALVAWRDDRPGISSRNSDLYMTRVTNGGSVAAGWTPGGTAVAVAYGTQQNGTMASDGAGGALLGWQDGRSGFLDIQAQRVDRFGTMGAEPSIVSVTDIPNDQGGQVKVSWTPSWLEADPNFVVSEYWVLRAVPPNLATQALADVTRLTQDAPALAGDPAAAGAPGDPGARRAWIATGTGANVFYWEYLTSVPANYLGSYSYTTPTTADSTTTSNPRTEFLIQARNGSATQWWNSAPDSGYSVDNLGPATPAPFAGNYASGATHLHWNPNREADLAGYRLYKGTSAGFTPASGNLVDAQPDTGYVDTGTAGSYYKLSAVDIHGNESGFALLTPGQTLGLDIVVPVEISLGRPVPNPSGGPVDLEFGLPREASVALAVFDAHGRKVVDLARGRWFAGQHVLRWDGRDAAGRAVPSGVYFVRLDVDGRVIRTGLARVR